jgi:hypothetical protein
MTVADSDTSSSGGLSVSADGPVVVIACEACSDTVESQPHQPITAFLDRMQAFIEQHAVCT